MSQPTTPLSADSIATLADLHTVQANGETWRLPACWTDDEVIVHVAIEVSARKKKKHEDAAPKVKPPASIGGIRK